MFFLIKKLIKQNYKKQINYKSNFQIIQVIKEILTFKFIYRCYKKRNRQCLSLNRLEIILFY